MNKLATKIEAIFKFRLLDNKDIPTYLRRMSMMGKFDEVKRGELLVLILDTLGKMEEDEKQNVALQPGAVLEAVALDVLVGESLTDTKEGSFPCPDCDVVAKSRIGLLSHARKHNK